MYSKKRLTQKLNWHANDRELVDGLFTPTRYDCYTEKSSRPTDTDLWDDAMIFRAIGAQLTSKAI